LRFYHLLEGMFLSRLTRFSVLAKIGNREVLAYLPNSGRLTELLKKGNKIFLLPRTSLERKTDYDLLFVYQGDGLVCVDARLPNYLFSEALNLRVLREFGDCQVIQKEVEYKGSRIDFLLSNDWLVEVKSVTLVRDGIGLFPDAPTLRGRRHLKDLMDALKEGYRTAVVFIIQREDAWGFRPNTSIDPQFSLLLRKAWERGLSIHAYGCRVRKGEIRIERRVRTYLPEWELTSAERRPL